MSAHLRVEQVADLTEGLLDEAEAASARAHLDRCVQCQQVNRQLEQLQAVLAAEGAESPAMPVAVAERIDAALARQTRATPARWPRALVAAASVVVVGAAIGYALERLPDAGSSDTASTTVDVAGGQTSPEHSQPSAERGGAGDKRPSQEDATGGYNELGAPAPLRLDLDRFGTQVREKLSGAPLSTDARYQAAAMSRRVVTCVNDALGPGATGDVTLLDGRLDGRRVTLVVQPQDVERRKVFAVECAGEPRVLAKTSLR